MTFPHTTVGLLVAFGVRPGPQARVIFLAAFLVATGTPASSQAQTAQTVTKAPSVASRSGAPVTLNFINADIEAVSRTIAVISGRNVVVDPRVKGTMTLVTSVPATPAQALRLFSAQLRTQGFALVESSGLFLVVPEADAKLQSGAVSAS